ncbi:MAG TPA: glycosyltransferase family 4 protein, partial [Flavisolibacter sp.]|nr:glycosyltransferase family 4 protein [Flavisolibacter sp.]
VDLGLFQRNEPEHVCSEKIKIAFIGNVSYRKGADVLLRVWGRIMQACSNVELHFYGNLQMDIPSSVPGTFFHGFISQAKLIKELQSMDISVLPSFFEGSSIAIYQSMALGLAVLTTPNAGSIITDKRNGLLIPYGDEQQLFEKLLLLISDREYRKYLSENALSDIKNYTWDQYGKRLSYILYENIYAPLKNRSLAKTQ